MRVSLHGNQSRFHARCLPTIQSLLIPVATITLTSNVDGRRACPGEVVTYTCTVIQGGAITWTAAPVLVDQTAVVFLAATPSDNSRSCPSATVQCADLDYQAAFTNVGPLMNGAADMTSTFRFTARAELNGTTVQCSAVTATATPSTTQTLNVAGE